MKLNRILPRGVSLLAVLLCTLGMDAQMYLQYWFDTDTKAQKAELSGATAKKSIDVQHLSQGLHTLYMRVRNPGAEYEYSPITTSTFIKFTTSEGSQLQYWFDEDVDNLSTIDVDAASGQEQTLMLDLANIERFPLGVHQLNMRMANGGRYSPVSSAYVLRLPDGVGDSKLEYWFDDDYQNRTTEHLRAVRGYRETVKLDLSNSTRFPYGIHRLNIRVAIAGTQFSPVYSTTVMKRHEGEKPDITYWVDDDYENRRIWKTKLKSDGSYYQLIQLPSISEGMHRLHMRVTNNGIDNGTVYEDAFLLSKRYKSTYSSSVMMESTWVDDATPLNKDLNSHLYTYTGSYVLDPAQYSEGQHAFHVQYKNSYDMWSAQNVTYFYKDASGMLRAGLLTPEDDITTINETNGAEQFSCYYRPGVVVVDCQSSKLAATGVVVVCDLMGRVVAREEVDCSNGLHAELNVNSMGRQMLIVKVHSGDVYFYKKLVAK